MMLIFTPLVGDGDVLGQDRDAPLAFQVVGVEDLLADQLRFAEPAALAQHAIDQASSCRGRRGR